MTKLNPKPTKVASRTSGVALKLIMILSIIVLAVALWAQFNKESETHVKAVSREGVVSRIQNLNRLETVAYNVDTVITSEKEGSWQRLWTDEQKGLFIARGRVVAGVDLSQISNEMVQISEPTEAQIEAAKQTALAEGNDNQTITIMPNILITLPPSQIFSVYLDDIEVYDWQAGMFGMFKANPDILAAAQKSAKAEVLERACKDGVMTQAAENAQKQMQQLFAMTGAEVTVATQGAGSCHQID